MVREQKTVYWDQNTGNTKGFNFRKEGLDMLV